MSFYINELKNRFFLILFHWVCLLLTGYLYRNFLVFKILKINELFLDYLLFNELYDLFLVYSSIIFSFSNCTVSIFLFFHFLVFFRKALYFREYKALANFYILSVLNFVLSFTVFNYLLFPGLLKFFIKLFFDHKGLADFFLELKVLNYVYFYLDNFLAFIILSQVLFTVLFLVSIYVKVRQIKHLKKYMHVLFVVLITVLTPPDVATQLVSFIVFIFLFEAYVFLLCLLKKQLIW